MLYFKALGKKTVLTAHNVNAAERDGCDSVVNRCTLRIQYSLADHIFVHTDKMQHQLTDRFGVQPRKISVIPYPVYDGIPRSAMTRVEARRRLGIRPSDRVLLFFGRIVPYKGLHYLVEAFEQLMATDPDYKLIIAGDPMKDLDKYWAQLKNRVGALVEQGRCIASIEFIADDNIEVYFKAADAVVLPYTHIFQSGPLFIAYSFGVPVIATDVGSFSRDIIAGTTGYVCAPADSVRLAAAIKEYFASDLYARLPKMQGLIRDMAYSSHSWDIVGARTQAVYTDLLA